MSGRDSNALLSRSDFRATGVLVETDMAWSVDHVPPPVDPESIGCRPLVMILVASAEQDEDRRPSP